MNNRHTSNYNQLNLIGREPAKPKLSSLYVDCEVKGRLKFWRRGLVVKRGRSYYWQADDHNRILVHRIGDNYKFQL